MAIIDLLLRDFVQVNAIVKGGKELLMSGELDLTGLNDASVPIVCYIGKKKRQFSQEMEGNVNSFQAYICARTDVDPSIQTHDLLITARGDKFIIGAVSIRNDSTSINSQVNDAEYLYADLELYSEVEDE